MSQQEILSKFHDAELISIRIDRLENIVVLGFIDVNENIKQLFFSNVIAFRINDLIIQNSISRIIASPDQSLREKEITHWLEWVTSVTGTKSMVTEEAFQRYIQQILNNDLSLFIIEPSWGAEGAIICKTIHCDE